MFGGTLIRLSLLILGSRSLSLLLAGLIIRRTCDIAKVIYIVGLTPRWAVKGTSGIIKTTGTVTKPPIDRFLFCELFCFLRWHYVGFFIFAYALHFKIPKKRTHFIRCDITFDFTSGGSISSINYTMQLVCFASWFLNGLVSFGTELQGGSRFSDACDIFRLCCGQLGRRPWALMLPSAGAPRAGSLGPAPPPCAPLPSNPPRSSFITVLHSPYFAFIAWRTSVTCVS